MQKILVPIDGSNLCKKVYRMATKLANTFDAEIILIHVQEPVQPFVWVNEAYVAEKVDLHLEEHSLKLLKEAKDFFKDQESSRDIKISTKTDVGDPAHAIIETADELEVDMILMCTHGMSAIKRFLMGSVTNKVLHHAKQSVFVIR